MDRFRAMSYTRPPFARPFEARAEHDAGWSSPVARQAHNLKVVGSNPAPATTEADTPEPSRPGVVAF